jgi:hypothetical protein
MNLAVLFMLNSDVYTEGFYQKGFQRYREIYMCKIVLLRAHERGRNIPLKCRGLWISSVFGVRYIHLQCPTIFCQYTWGSLALVPLFHSHNVLAKSLTVFVSDFSEIFWQKIQVWRQKVDFQTHIASHSFVRSQQVLHNIVIVRCFVIS